MQVSVIVVHAETKELAFWSTCCKKNIAGPKIQSKYNCYPIIKRYEDQKLVEYEWVLV